MAEAPARPFRGDLAAAMCGFVAVNLVLLAINGVRQGGDSPLYLDGAQRLLSGAPLIDRQPSYAGYVAIVAAGRWIGAGLVGVAVFQVLLGAVAAAAVYAIGFTLAGRAAGIIGAVLYAVDVDTNRWHQFILADSTYLSLFAIGVWLVYRASVRRGLEPVCSAVAVIGAAGLVRPEGWFLLGVALCFMVVMRAQSVRERVAGLAAVAGAAVVLIVLLGAAFRGNVQAVGPADMLQRGQTIWDYDGWRVSMPPAAPARGSQAMAAIAYAMQHPFDTLGLMSARVAVHFAHVRPFYSTAHNLVIVGWLVPAYAAAVFAVWRIGATSLTLWLLAAIASQTLVVALTHAEWDGRYLAHVLPVIDALVGAGVAMAMGRSSQQAHG